MAINFFFIEKSSLGVWNVNALSVCRRLKAVILPVVGGSLFRRRADGVPCIPAVAAACVGVALFLLRSDPAVKTGHLTRGATSLD